MNYTQEYNTLKSDFWDFFLTRGYKQEPAAPLNSKVDPSVFLVGSCTNIFKQYFLNNAINPQGHALIQPAVNTKQMRPDNLFDTKRFYSTYNVLGLLQQPQRLEQLINDTYTFITTVVGLAPSDLFLRTNYNDIDFVALAQNKYTCKFEHSDYGTHSFGFYNELPITGRHASFYYKGNNVTTISMYKYNGEHLGNEMTSTIESLLIAKYGLQNTMQISVLNDYFKAVTHADFYYYDCITAIAEMIYSGIRPNSSHMDGRTFKKYISCINSAMGNISNKMPPIPELVWFYINSVYPQRNAHFDYLIEERLQKCL